MLTISTGYGKAGYEFYETAALPLSYLGNFFAPQRICRAFDH